MTTYLEERLEKKRAEQQERTYLETWSSCIHEDMRFLGEIGAVKLSECQSCGLTVGVGK